MVSGLFNTKASVFPNVVLLPIPAWEYFANETLFEIKMFSFESVFWKITVIFLSASVYNGLI